MAKVMFYLSTFLGKFIFFVFIILQMNLYTALPPEVPKKALNVKDTEEEDKEPAPSKGMMENYIYSTIQGNNFFAFDLYSKLKKTNENLCFSPYSITSAVALPFTGSKGTTQSDMRLVMHYLNQANEVIDIYGNFDKLYTTSWHLGPNESRFFLGNSLWLQRDIRILPAFLGKIPKFYHPLIKSIDFYRNSEGAKLNINEWIHEKTQGRVSKGINNVVFEKNTQMLVVSSIFMKGVWLIPFNQNFSKEMPFFIDQATTTSVTMMVTSGRFRFYQTKEFTVLELPYRSSFKAIPQIALAIVLPISNFGLASIEEKFYLDEWNRVVNGATEERVIVTIPTFSLSESFDLTSLLKVMGMNLAFSDQADFSGLSDKENLRITSILHYAYLSIDEKGSDAIFANPIAINDQPVLNDNPSFVFTANHPFLFLIVDKTNNLILYMGRFVKP
jgi:serpin B